jgi:hypothetical protein
MVLNKTEGRTAFWFIPLWIQTKYCNQHILLIFVFSATCNCSTTIIRHYCTKIYKNSVRIQ